MLIEECFEYNQHFVAMMNIINLAKKQNIEGKFERHHIIPKCFYKVKGLEIDNSESNLVNLTHEQHQKVHKLAVLCANEIVLAKLRAAAYLMETYAAKTRLGGHLSKEHKDNISNANKGHKVSDETRAKISASLKGMKSNNKGKKLSDEQKAKISASEKGKKVSAETRAKMSASQKGKKLSAETRAKMSASRKGKKRGPYKENKQW